MLKELTDIDLCEKVWSILQEQLGPVQTLRFLSLVQREPRDYLKWRDEHFANVPADQILDELERMEGSDPSA